MTTTPSILPEPLHRLTGVKYRPAAEAASYLRAGVWLNLTIRDAIRNAGVAFADHSFIIAEDAALSFAAYDGITERLAAALLKRGLRPGDRALFQMGTSAATAVAMGGCFKAGVLPVCTLAQHRDIEIGQLGRMTAPKAYFVQADFHPTFDLTAFARKMAAELGTVQALIVARGSGGDGLAMEALIESIAPSAARAIVDAAPLSPADVAVFQLSGGSTGVPKIIPRMHGEYLAQSRDWNERMHLEDKDPSLWCLPLIHNAGTVAAFLPSLLRGAPIVLQSSFREEAFLDAIERYRVAYTGSLGPVVGRLLDSPLVARYNLSSMRAMWAFSRTDDLEERLGLRAQCIYGITEGILMCSAPDAPKARRFYTVGSPVGRRDEVMIRALDEDRAVEDGAVGELCFKGASVLSAYYGVEPDAATFTADGFFRTGDLVRTIWIDGERCVAFEGRLKDNINRGGEKYGAEEVEVLIAKHPAILDARVVAMPDRLYGERGCAYLVVRPGHAAPSVGELASFLSGLGLAKYKCPERIETLEQFPLTRIGKVDKIALRQWIAAIVGGEQLGGTDRPA